MTDLVHAIDVSNWQPWAADPQSLQEHLAPIDPPITHVIVRLSLETPTLSAISVTQLQAASISGYSVGGYVWAYPDSVPTDTVRNALALVADAGVTLPILWIDLEEQDGPGTWWIDRALALARRLRRGLRPGRAPARCPRVGIYTGLWWWGPHMGEAEFRFPGVPLWTANYNDKPDLDVPTYGGLELVGHQWTNKAPDGSGLDRSVLLAAYT